MNAVRTIRDVFAIGILAAGVIICIAYFGGELTAFPLIALGAITWAGLR